jgi:predicted negative regulator of RcsB-dependent stress response
MDGSGTKSTLDLYFNLPELRALLALKNHRPADAVKELDPARKYQMRDIGVPYQRARAEVEAGMLDQAAQDYRLILDNPGNCPIWPEHTISHLRLARVLALEKKTDEARSEYRAFFDAWKDADPGLKILADAKREFAQLQ